MSTPRLATQRLYIADLARRQADMESGLVAMHPVGYRVLAKRLRQALAGQPAARLRRGFPELPQALQPLVDEALEARHFDEHGALCGGAAGNAVRDAAEGLLSRLIWPRARQR